MSHDAWQVDAAASYDRVAAAYAERTRSGLEDLPWMRAAFTQLVTLVSRSGGGLVLDVGCGPGWITGYLVEQGVDAFGVDISSEMIRIARHNNPGVRFESTSLFRLPADDSTLAAVVCWFVLHHLPDEDVEAALAEMTRVLKPGGVLLLGGHVGEGRRVKTEGYGGHPMRVLVNLRPANDWEPRLRRLGFRLEAHTTYDIDEPSPWHALYARKGS
jgi:ubiquinone/menaquinone biosynthesis C-methylase UbiE